MLQSLSIKAKASFLGLFPRPPTSWPTITASVLKLKNFIPSMS